MWIYPYNVTLLPYFWKMIARTRILVITQTQGAKNHNSAMVEAMDPIPDYAHINVKHKYSTVYFTICICYCGYAYEGVLTTHHVTPALVGNAFGGYNSGYCPRGKPQHSAVVEAMDPSQITPASMSNTCKVYFIMFICRGCGCACGYVLTTLLLLLLTMLLEDS